MSNIFVGWKESSDPPAPWTRLTRQGKYIRLTDTAAYHLVATGALTHNHDNLMASFSVDACVGYTGTSSGYLEVEGIHTHANPSSYSITSANNDPSYYSLDIIYMDFAVWKTYHRKFPDGTIVLSNDNLGGAGSGISAYSSSVFYVVNGDNCLWCNTSGSWAKISTTEIKKTSISSDGTIYAIDYTSGAALRWNGSSWDNLSGTLLEIAAYNSSIVYGIGGDNGFWICNSGAWSQISATPIKKISVASDGTIYAIDYTSGAALRWNGSSWTDIGGECLELAAYNSSIVYVIGSDLCLYVYNSGFTKLSTTTIKKISVASDGTVYAIDYVTRSAIKWNGSSWTNCGGINLTLVRFDEADGKYIVNNTPATTGGSIGTRTHLVYATTGTGNEIHASSSGDTLMTAGSHTHAIENLATSGNTNEPRTLTTRLYEILNTYVAACSGMVAFCDGTPDADWEILSTWKDANLKSDDLDPTLSGSDTHNETVSGNTTSIVGADNKSSGVDSMGVRRSHVHPVLGTLQSVSHVPLSILLMPIKLNVTYSLSKPRSQIIGIAW